jgi:hypothetical protein
MHHDPMTILDKINGYMPLKPSLVGDPDIYLGTKLRQTRLKMAFGHGVQVPPNTWHMLSRTVKSIYSRN